MTYLTGGPKYILPHTERALPCSPRKLSSPVYAKPPMSMRSLPIIAEPGKPSINRIDPRELIVARLKEFEAAKPIENKIPPSAVREKGWQTTSRRVAAGSLVAVGLTLLPQTAFAAPLLTLASNPLGLVALGAGALVGLSFYVKYMFGFDKTMNARNDNPGDPTLRKQLAVFSMVPLSILTGSGLLYFGACLLPWGAAPTFFALAGAGLVYGTVKFVQSVVKTIKANRQTISPGYKTNVRQIIETNLLSHLVQGAEAAYGFYRGATLFELIYGVVAFTGAHAVAAASLSALGTGALAIGVPAALLTSLYLRFTSKKWNALQHQFGPRFDLNSARGIRNTVLAVAGSLAGGALLYTFFAPLANLAFAMAFFFTEVHALVHNWSCQGGSREIIQTPPEEYSDAAVWNAARRPNSPWITVLKPGFEPNDFIVPTYALLYLRKGVNWDFNIVSGINMGIAGLFKESHETLNFLRQKEEAILNIIASFQTQIAAEQNLADKYGKLAELYEALAKHWEAESVGNFSNLTVTKEYKGVSDAFISPDANEFERYLGESIRYEAGKFRKIADNLKNRALVNASLSQAEIDEEIEGLNRQYGLIFHWFAPKQFRNICPDQIKSKIREIDLFNHLCRTYKTGASVLRKNRHTGEYYWEILPCKRIRKLDPQTKTLSWADRPPEELAATESYSDIRLIDNTGMADPTGAGHSREAYTYGDMKDGDSIAFEYKDGTRVTYTKTNGQIVPSGTQDSKADEVVWLPGMPIDLQLLRSLPIEWFVTADKELAKKVPEDYKGTTIEINRNKYWVNKEKDKNKNDIFVLYEYDHLHEVFKPALLHFFGSHYQTMCDGEHADIITSDFLAPLEKDIKDAYILGMWKVPEKIEVPNARHLRENTNTDELVRISPSYANFMLRVKEISVGGRAGKVLYIPYNWMKNTKIAGTVWANIHHVELITRKDFYNRYEVVAKDGHGDKFDNVIIAYDSTNRKLGTLPYSYSLRDPAAYESAEFDRGLGRYGDMNFVAYTFKRADGSRYMRWLPREDDWPEMDFEEKNETKFENKGDKIVLHTCRWIGKRFAFDPDRLLINPGTHEKPTFKVTGIEGPEKFLNGIRGATGKHVLGIKDAAGQVTYQAFAGNVNNMDNVVDQQVVGNDLQLFHVDQDNKQVINLGHDEKLLTGQPLAFPSTWISSVKIEKSPNKDKFRLNISYTNPFTGLQMPVQSIDLDRGLFPELDKIYQNGGSEAYLPKIFNQRQKNQKTGQIENKIFLTFYTCETETVRHGLALTLGDKVRLIEVNSSLLVQRKTVDGKTEEVWLPFDKKMPQVKAKINFAENTPFSSGLSFGHVDTMVAPQHLIPLKAGVGPEWATDDQKFYFGEVYDGSGEYNWPAGWVRQQKMNPTWSKGPFSLQYAKSIRGAALNTGSNTVMRAPHLDLLFQREELEVYADKDGLPVSLYKSLFDKTTTTEDAQGAWEKKRIFDMDTRNDRTVRSAGASVKSVGEGMGQRGRWAAMLIFLQRIPKIFSDELIRARLLRRIPSQYSNKQLHEWFNTFTWYLDTLFKHVVPLIPLAYMVGLSPLPAGAIVFPLIWAIKTGTGWPKYSSDNQKMGVSRIRSYFKNLALNYLYIPNISRNTTHINDEAKGPFVSTAGIGGKTFFPWATRRIVYYFGGISGVTTAVGLYRLAAFGMFSLGYFGLVMNVIWPAVMFVSVAYALRMVWAQMKEAKELDGPGFLSSARQALRTRNSAPLREWWRQFRRFGERYELFKNEFLKPLTIDWFKELADSFKEAARYYRSK